MSISEPVLDLVFSDVRLPGWDAAGAAQKNFDGFFADELPW